MMIDADLHGRTLEQPTRFADALRQLRIDQNRNIKSRLPTLRTTASDPGRKR